MKWFKHHSDFRQTPAMSYIAEELGDMGVAGVYRLYEVFAQRFGANDDFSGTLLLQPPFTERWLAQEILTPRLSDAEIENPYTDVHAVPIEQLNRFLKVCVEAGILKITTETCSASQIQPDGTLKQIGDHTWRRLAIPGFADLKDEWAGRSRLKSKALSTPE